MSEQENGSVDKLKKKLYRRGTFRSDVSRAPFSLPKETTPDSWQDAESDIKQSLLNPRFLKKFFIFSSTFFILAILVAVYIYKSGNNVISPDGLELVIKGPASIRGGEILNFNILVANHNAIPLESVDLIVTFPEGTREAGALEKDLPRVRKNLASIDPGRVINESIKAVLFGESGTEKEILVAIEYRTPGSNAIFEKKKSLSVLVSSSPVNLEMKIPNEVNVGDELEFEMNISAGSAPTGPLSKVLLSLDYPSGFRFSTATPKPAFGNNTWDLGTFEPTATRKIRIKGTISGQDGEKKLFKSSVGVVAVGKDGIIGVPYGSASATVLLRRAFVDLGATLNSESGESVVVSSGKVIRGDVNWTNNLPDKILNAQITVRFTGNALDQSSVLLPKGFYRSTDDSIVWTEQHENALAVVEPDSSAHLNFDFATLPTSVLNRKGIINPSVGMEITFEGARVTSGQENVSVFTKVNKIIRVNTRLVLSADAVYNRGPFQNSGPLPPRANQETTYTIFWTIVNTSNNLEDVRVKAIIPSQVRFIGSVSPAGTDLHYNSNKGELSWNAGILVAKASDAPSKEVAFQVAVVPSVPQVGQVLPLISDMVLSGRDSFTGAELSYTHELVDTRITTDPNYKEDLSRVVP